VKKTCRRTRRRQWGMANTHPDQSPTTASSLRGVALMLVAGAGLCWLRNKRRSELRSRRVAMPRPRGAFRLAPLVFRGEREPFKRAPPHFSGSGIWTIAAILHSQDQSIRRCVNVFTYPPVCTNIMPACSSPRLGPATWGHFSSSTSSRSAEVRKIMTGRLFKNDSGCERLHIHIAR
jgi:hypothetical protein